MLQVGARADVDVQPRHRKTMAAGAIDALGNLRVPNAVLRLLAAGVRLLAMAVAETGVHPQRNLSARRPRAELIDHVGRAAVDVDAAIDAEIERLGVEDVGRVDDRRRIALGGEAGGQGAEDFARADRIDQAARAADEIENRKIRAGLFRVADNIEGRQVGDAATDHSGVVDESGRSKPSDQFGDRHVGDVGT